MAALKTPPPWLEMTVEEVRGVTRSQFQGDYVSRMDHGFAKVVLDTLEEYFEKGVVVLVLSLPCGMCDWLCVRVPFTCAVSSLSVISYPFKFVCTFCLLFC